MNQVLLVAVHESDEVLGCGRTITRHVDSGDQVQVLIVAEESTSLQQERDNAEDGVELLSLTQGGETQVGFKVVDVFSLLRQLL